MLLSLAYIGNKMACTVPHANDGGYGCGGPCAQSCGTPSPSPSPPALSPAVVL